MSSEPSGPKLDQLRRRVGISQRKLAPQLGISQGHLSRLLRAEVDDPHRHLPRLHLLLLQQRTSRRTTDELLADVETAARGSRRFRALLEAALAMVQSDK